MCVKNKSENINDSLTKRKKLKPIKHQNDDDNLYAEKNGVSYLFHFTLSRGGAQSSSSEFRFFFLSGWIVYLKKKKNLYLHPDDFIPCKMEQIQHPIFFSVFTALTGHLGALHVDTCDLQRAVYKTAHFGLVSWTVMP